LRAWAADAGGGLAGYGGNWRVAPDSVLKPDVWWIGPARLASIDLAAATVSGPPDLAVEVRSPGTWVVDVGRKRALYEAAGLAELWLVDPPARSVLVLRRSGPGAPFDEFVEPSGTDRLASPLLPGFGAEVDPLFP
jgi:Uma2 family endonuclease